MNALAFVDHEIGCRLLTLLLAPERRRRLNLRAVVTTAENGHRWWPGVAELCRQHGLPLLRYPCERAAVAQFGEIDVVLLLSWKHLLPTDWLSLPARGTVNLHYSLLPRYRGVYPVNWALMRGDPETGVTFHWVTAAIDAGSTICQAALPIRPEDTARSLQLRLDDLACELLDPLLERLEATAAGAAPGAPAASAPYFSRRDFEATNEIDLRRTTTAGELIDLLRGKTFLPHARHAFFRDPATGKKIYLSLVLEPEERVNAPGP